MSFVPFPEPVPVKVVDNIGAVSRPHAPAQMLERQGSFRGFQKLSETSPFKRQLSLRINELPSTLERQRNAYSNGVSSLNGPAGKTMGQFWVPRFVFVHCGFKYFRKRSRNETLLSFVFQLCRVPYLKYHPLRRTLQTVSLKCVSS